MSKDEYLITDAPLKALTVFAMPMILGSFFQQIYNMADTIIVGKFVGNAALAAVGSCGTLMFLILGVSNGIDCRVYGCDSPALWCGKYESYETVGCFSGNFICSSFSFDDGGQYGNDETYPALDEYTGRYV